jgi:hypothetical protein
MCHFQTCASVSQVRIAACGQLIALGAVMGPEAAKQALLPELAELLEDEEVQVRIEGYDLKWPLQQLLSA